MKDGPAAELQLELTRGSDSHTEVVKVNRELIVKHLESICRTCNTLVRKFV